jgi:hypothetical protein
VHAGWRHASKARAVCRMFSECAGGAAHLTQQVVRVPRQRASRAPRRVPSARHSDSSPEMR